ncbi:hypothetical protein H8356DRAFT_1349900 [Neocallimastix lanati (nom. inval.)]|jgi:hypothetical protein|uniref:SH3 domain-containing protein n=1 Tax=Neocallimastix californiae TaxID=1754190 RepID=A0A1Y2FRI1_9FUNG|nr:hypothetical protein H8356DRAFT_1349900 [Neocallimastix sp. JGI-2020a]ORY86621.1 hypothetical protein LY90DRAFT_498858 [Neocallimastix californiae]|eukprot:ORY86621.1 hypothetical protein LY90DRAFT_498858 [Neocallimastix californiae]
MIINCKRSLVTHIVLLLSILITKIHGACVQLTGSTSCPSFSSYSIDTVNGVFPLNSQPKYTDVASFDAYVIKYAEFLAKHFVSDLAVGSTCNTVEMENYALSNLRYLTTFACNFIVISKENTCQPVKPKVCKSTCNDFVNSYQGLVNQFNTCLNQATVSKQISTQNSRCTKDTSNFSALSQCIDSTNEGNCGFSSQANASTYCSTASTDACCSMNGGTSNVGANAGTNGGINSSTNGASASPSADTAANNTPATSSTKTANVNSALNLGKENESNGDGGSNKVWIIVGSCCAFLLVGALIYFYKKGESLDNTNSNNNNNSFYEQENKFPPFQPSMEERGINNSNGFSGGLTSPGMGGIGSMNAMSGNSFSGINNDNGDVLVNRTEMNNMGGKIDDDDEFNFGADSKNYNFTSNVTPGGTNQTMPITNDNGFNNATLFAGAAAGAAAIGAAVGAAAMNNNNEKKNEAEVPKPQMVNMTNIQPPESQDTSATPIIKIDEEPKPQMVNMTNIQPPESQDRNDTSQPPDITIDEEPKAQMVNMTEIPEPEIQQNRNTKFLSTYSEAPDNQRISSQFYGESEPSFDFSSSKINITSQLDNNHLSVASSGMNSNRISTTSTDKELNSTPYRAVHTYEPQLNDELLLEMGDIVEVVYVYDDGWVWGINTRTNESGACPMLCLEKVEGSETGSSVDERIKSIISTRESMISRDSVPGRRDSRILKVNSINK